MTTPALDLSGYRERVGLPASPPPTAGGLATLHLAHATHIPFENIDVLLKRPIRLDIESLQQKLVSARRGGYCFEQNMLFAAVLEHVGFNVTRLAARVRFRTPRTLARTHMLLLVATGDERWLADVGFGGSGLLSPLRVTHGIEQQQFFRRYRLLDNAGSWTLQGSIGDTWEDYYGFTLERQELADYEMANHYVATHPESPFTQRLTVQKATPEVRYTLRGSELAIERADRIETRVISSSEVHGVLRDMFGIDLTGDMIDSIANVEASRS